MPAAEAATDDRAVIDALRRGDEQAFAALIDRYNPSLLRVAFMYVRSRAVAEEVVQETWLGVLQGIDRFEERSSLKTWIFRILTNRAKTRAQREGRSVPFSALAGQDASDEPTVEPSRFRGPDEADPGGWATPPRSWSELPAEQLVARETLDHVRAAIDELPDGQRTVISLRDVEGWSAEEVRNALEISDVNQRVLLHRARARVRKALEEYLEPA